MLPRELVPNQFCEMSAMVTNYVNDLPRSFCDSMCNVTIEREFNVVPNSINIPWDLERQPRQ